MLNFKSVHQPNKKGEVRGLALGYQADQSSVFFLNSDLNFCSQASSTHDEKLTFGLFALSFSTLNSISLINSCGKRMFFFADLLFVFPVLICKPYLDLLGVRTPYDIKWSKRSVDVCAHLVIRCAHTLFVQGLKRATPQTVGAVQRRLTSDVNGDNAMAVPQCTQTHPKFTWRFLALGLSTREILSVDASTEREARELTEEKTQ